MSTNAAEVGPKTSWWPWPGLVVVLLAVNAGGTGALIYAACRNGTPASEPDFYQRGLETDRRASERAASDRLGWKAAATIESGVLRVTVTGATGDAVVVESAWAEVIHRSEKGQWERVDLTRDEAGGVRGVLARWAPGMYEVRVHASQSGGVRFVRTLVVKAGIRA